MMMEMMRICKEQKMEKKRKIIKWLKKNKIIKHLCLWELKRI